MGQRNDGWIGGRSFSSKRLAMTYLLIPLYTLAIAPCLQLKVTSIPTKPKEEESFTKQTGSPICIAPCYIILTTLQKWRLCRHK